MAIFGWLLLGLLVAVAGIAIKVWWPDVNRLMGCSAKGDIKGVRLCLRLGVDINEPSRWGWGLGSKGETALTAAAQNGRVEVVRYLLKHGAKINQPDGFGDTAIIRACYSGDLPLVALLFKQGGDPSFKGDSHTAMHLAAGLGHIPIMEFLMKKGVPVDIPGKDGKSPLYSASVAASLDGVRFLLAHGAGEKLDAASRKQLLAEMRRILGEHKRDYDEYAAKNGWTEKDMEKSKRYREILQLLEGE